MVNQAWTGFRTSGSGDVPFPPSWHHNQPSREAKQIPAADHAALVVQIVRFLLQCDLQGPVPGGDGGVVVPLEVARLPVVKVDGFPV